MRITKDTPGYLDPKRETATIADLMNPPVRPVVELRDSNEERRGLHPAFIADTVEVKS